MNYPAMRWVASEGCQAKGPARALLWVIAYHADRDTGECWVGQRRLAREAGIARTTVQRALDKLFADGILEAVEDSRGPHPERFQIAPAFVEGEASASGVVEGTASATGLVEGQAVIGEVIHNPGASGLTVSPQDAGVAHGVDWFRAASGLAQGLPPSLVDSLSERSGLTPRQANRALTSAKSDLPESQGLKQGSSTSREVHVRDAAAFADGGVAASYTPPEVDEEHKAWLRRRGLGQRHPPPVAQPPTAAADPSFEHNRAQQLGELERRYADEFKSRQEGEQSA